MKYILVLMLAIFASRAQGQELAASYKYDALIDVARFWHCKKNGMLDKLLVFYKQSDITEELGRQYKDEPDAAKRTELNKRMAEESKKDDGFMMKFDDVIHAAVHNKAADIARKNRLYFIDSYADAIKGNPTEVVMKYVKMPKRDITNLIRVELVNEIEGCSTH